MEHADVGVVMRARLRWVDIKPVDAFALLGAGQSELALFAWIAFVVRHTPYTLHEACFRREAS